MNIKKIIIALIILILVIGLAAFIVMGKQIKKLEEQDFSVVDIATLADGTYKGSASALVVTAKVDVAIKDGKIKQIELLEHSHGPGYGADAICDNIVTANTPDVDSISGATYSSIVIKSAVLQALKSGVTP
ncbi:MAG: FMN-binding protein [Christensenellales bacterium]|jgi:uncharacterized protein with FMN-binding domain